MIISDPADLLDRGSQRQAAGEWSAALALYDDAYRQAGARADLDTLLEAATRIGHCLREAGDVEAAHDTLEFAAAAAALAQDHWRAARALNGIAILHQSAGDIARAERVYLEAREHARIRGESVLGEIEQNLGILDNIRGDLEAALEHYRAGLQHLQATGHLRGSARALNNLGMLHIDMGRLDESDAYFQQGLELCEEAGDVVTAGAIHLNRAELYLAMGQPERARASCDEGFEIASRVHDDYSRAEALKYYGIIYHETGKLHLAEIHLKQAVEIAALRDPLLEAESLRELSLVLRAQARNREALEALNRAHSLFIALQARSDQEDINQRISKLETDFLSLVRFWGEAIEAKDRYTGGHCERVADYACRLATEAGIGEREMVWFRMGAFLHDLGKTEVAEEILNKPGRLTDEERAAMERHPVIGDEMLAPVEFPWDIRPMVRSHHERWDGRGYPDGLVADAIPVSARILRIADVFDALTTARSYRRRLLPEEALAIMEDDVGSFDPELFAIFKRVFPELVGRATEAQAQAAADPAGVP
ncbi:MAG TPA: HD domain-containing phosphohydrolase [Longimicrobium sp.]|nr:HD domain-containing phosphohydrolase [Longimicrobium sp.]